MLPSFRTIAATFFCGFLAVFAALRLATSLDDFHAALPVVAAQAAPVTVAQIEHGSAAAPTMFDLRFAVSTVAKAPPLNVTALVIDRTAPLVTEPPLQLVKEADPPPAEAAEPAKPADDPVAAAPAIEPNEP